MTPFWRGFRTGYIRGHVVFFIGAAIVVLYVRLF